MNYNQVTATTTSFSPDGALIGYTVRITEYPFDLFVMLANVGLFLFIVLAFVRRRHKSV